MEEFAAKVLKLFTGAMARWSFLDGVQSVKKPVESEGMMYFDRRQHSLCPFNASIYTNIDHTVEPASIMWSLPMDFNKLELYGNVKVNPSNKQIIQSPSD